MAKKVSKQPLKLGDCVHILHSGYSKARIVELRGPLGPSGELIYRVRIRDHKASKPTFIELREDQLRHIPADDSETT